LRDEKEVLETGTRKTVRAPIDGGTERKERTNQPEGGQTALDGRSEGVYVSQNE